MKNDKYFRNLIILFTGSEQISGKQSSGHVFAYSFYNVSGLGRWWMWQILRTVYLCSKQLSR